MFIRLLAVLSAFVVSSFVSLSAYSMPKNIKSADQAIMVGTCYKLNTRGNLLSERIIDRYDALMRDMDEDEIEEVFWYLLDRKSAFERNRQISHAIIYSAALTQLFPEIEESMTCKTY